MDLTGAVIFAKVVEAKGFSAAGRLLAIPKTTVSKKVSDLEASLGIRLLNRTTRHISLTEAGTRVYAHCVAALRHLDAAQREADALQHQPEGLLTIAAPGAIGVPFVLPALTAFMERYPAVQVTLLSMNELADLDRDRIDVMIWAGGAMPPGHAVRLVARVDIALYASSSYVARNGAPTAPQELAGHRAVAVTPSIGGGSRFVWRLQRATTTIEVTPSAQPRFRSNDPNAVLSAVAAGYGIAGLPTRLVDHLAEGRSFVPILPDWRISPIEISALFRDASSLKTRLLLDFIADWFRRL